MNELIKAFGLVGFAITWVAISLMFLIWEVDKGKSISHHAAAQKHSFVMMAIVETISLSAFIIFAVGWIAPTYGLSMLFSILCTLIGLGLLIAAWVPVTGAKGRIHDICAYGAALLFIPVTAILATSPTIATDARVINAVATICMIGLIASFALVKKTRGYHLYLQSSYILIFDMSILAAAYLK